MKIKTLIPVIHVAVSTIVFLTGCSPKSDDTAQNETSAAQQEGPSSPTQPHFEVNESFQKQLADVFTSYIDVKNALVSSDASRATTEAAEAADALAKVDTQLVSGAARNDWTTYATTLQSALEEIQAGDNIETQRKAFGRLSENLYKTIKAFGLGGEEAFYEFCPMAFNNEGAYWLSENDQIRNPYFGDQMLKCGEVTERLR